MTLQTAYLTCMCIGFGLVLLTLLGGDADDVETADIDVDDGIDLAGWLPIASLRFWTFFLAGFGVVGLSMSTAGMTMAVSLASSIGAGYGLGILMSGLYRRVQRSGTDSSIGSGDYLGCLAQVMVPIAKGKTGKIRLELKGRTVEFLAETEEEGVLEAEENVIVYGMADGGHVVVARQGRLPAGS